MDFYTALFWQKEAIDKSPKSEKVMFLDWTYFYSTSISKFGAETLILLKDNKVTI